MIDINYYVKAADRYAENVISKKEIANKYIILECERHVKNLNDENCDYYFDYELAETICKLLLLINFPTGFCLGKSLLVGMNDFQFFILFNIFCWKHKETHYRKYSEVVLQIARKNGKTFLIGVINLIGMLVSDDFSQLYSAAETRQLASLVFDEMVAVLSVSPHIKRHFKVTKQYIECTAKKTVFKTASSEANNSNGLRPQLFLIDECGILDTPDLYKALRLGQMSVRSPLGIAISTAYQGKSLGYFKGQCDYCKKILDGLIENENVFSMLFELDTNDDWTDQSVWAKASPLQMSIDEGKKFMTDEYSKAIENPSEMVEFRTKILNQWLDGQMGEVFCDIDDLKNGILSEPYDWTGRKVYVGVDMSLSGDNTAVSICTWDEVLDSYVVASWCFIPGENLEAKSKVEKIPYDVYIRQGICFKSNDRTVNYTDMENFIMSLPDKLGVEIINISYDKYNATSSINRIQSETTLECLEMPQRSSVLTLGTRTIKERVMEGRFKIDGRNNLLLINFQNAKLCFDSNMNLYINKKLSYTAGKIDMVAALINAVTACETDLIAYYTDYNNYEFKCI